MELDCLIQILIAWNHSSLPVDDVSGRTSLQETESVEQKCKWPLHRFLVCCEHHLFVLLLGPFFLSIQFL